MTQSHRKRAEPSLPPRPLTLGPVLCLFAYLGSDSRVQHLWCGLREGGKSLSWYLCPWLSLYQRSVKVIHVLLHRALIVFKERSGE